MSSVFATDCLDLWRGYESLPLTAMFRVATPAAKEAEAETLFPKGIRKVKPYLRYTPQPNR